MPACAAVLIWARVRFRHDLQSWLGCLAAIVRRHALVGPVPPFGGERRFASPPEGHHIIDTIPACLSSQKFSP